MFNRDTKEVQKQEALLSDTALLTKRAGPRPHTTPSTSHIQQDHRARVRAS